MSDCIYKKDCGQCSGCYEARIAALEAEVAQRNLMCSDYFDENKRLRDALELIARGALEAGDE